MEESPVLKRILPVAVSAVALAALAACGSGSAAAPSATGGAAGGDAHRRWASPRSAPRAAGAPRTPSIQEAAEAAGIELKFSDAQQKQENQIKAIRSYIQQKVDVIAFCPVVETGWDTVLKEAKDANIPVILTDRAVDSKDTSLYKTFLGSDFVLEGKKAGEWLVEEYAGKTDTVNVVELQGTTGAAPANRPQGGLRRRRSRPTRSSRSSRRRPVTSPAPAASRSWRPSCKSNPDIDVVYAHNDDMGLGAIEAIEAAGKVPGKDIKIITVDAVKDGMQALADGKINFIVECTPLLGDQLMDLAKKVIAGETVPSSVVTEETTFTQEQAKAALPDAQVLSRTPDRAPAPCRTAPRRDGPRHPPGCRDARHPTQRT